jgi:hypothetical protein
MSSCKCFNPPSASKSKKSAPYRRAVCESEGEWRGGKAREGGEGGETS